MSSLASALHLASLSFDGVVGAVSAFAAAFLFVGILSHYRGRKDNNQDS